MKPLDQFDFAFNPSINRRQIYDLATCRFIRERRDVLWLGPPGAGKSFLVQAIGHQAIKSGFQVYYRSVLDKDRDFLKDETLGGPEKVLNKYLLSDLVIIDDTGMKSLPPRSGEFLFEIVMRRHELRSTMMTSNRPLGGLGEADRRRTGRQCYPRSIPASCRIDQHHWKELSPAESRREWPR